RDASTSRPVHTLIRPSEVGGSGMGRHPSACGGAEVDGAVVAVTVVVEVGLGEDAGEEDVDDPPHAAATTKTTVDATTERSLRIPLASCLDCAPPKGKTPEEKVTERSRTTRSKALAASRALVH
ncbi:MAG: hypothetical protein WBC76_02985, partial [Actinomycetes bacterium]